MSNANAGFSCHHPAYSGSGPKAKGGASESSARASSPSVPDGRHAQPGLESKFYHGISSDGESSYPIQNGNQPLHNDTSAEHDAESPHRMSMNSPISPTSPPLRKLSSHASDMGRRLAQERSKNHQFMQQIRELEHTVSLLRGGNVDATRNYPSPGFTSPPVSTPPVRGEAVHPPEINPQNANCARDLDGELREAAAANTSQKADSNDDSIKNSASFEISSDSAVMGLLQKASKLLSEDEGFEKIDNPTSSEPNTEHGRNDGLALTQERMHEYHELVTAFHSEQQSHCDLDGEELISREDILWLFQELKWRFEDIIRGFDLEISKKKEESLAENVEWKECLEGLVNVVKKAMTSTPSPPSSKANNLEDDKHTDNTPLSNETRNLQNEVSSLNQRLASFASQHKETCRSLYDDMEAMKRDYQEQLANRSQCIQNLESKISEQEEYIAQIQKEAQKDQQWIQQEKQKITMSKEGTSMRIQYLEGMLRSLQMELKVSKIHQGKRGGANSTTTIQTSDAIGDDKQEALSPPVFMRDLTSTMHDSSPLQVEHIAAKTKPVQRVESKAGHDMSSTKKYSNEITKLRDQVATLGSSLADSETRRANLLEGFQKERQKYILQYKQMSDILKLLIEDEKGGMI